MAGQGFVHSRSTCPRDTGSSSQLLGLLGGRGTQRRIAGHIGTRIRWRRVTLVGSCRTIRLIARGTGRSGGPTTRTGATLGRQLALLDKVLQVGHEAQAHRVLDVHALDGDKVPGHFGGALTEADDVIVHGHSLRVIAQ